MKLSTKYFESSVKTFDNTASAVLQNVLYKIRTTDIFTKNHIVR